MYLVLYDSAFAELEDNAYMIMKVAFAPFGFYTSYTHNSSHTTHRCKLQSRCSTSHFQPGSLHIATVVPSTPYVCTPHGTTTSQGAGAGRAGAVSIDVR